MCVFACFLANSSKKNGFHIVDPGLMKAPNKEKIEDHAMLPSGISINSQRNAIIYSSKQKDLNFKDATQPTLIKPSETTNTFKI